MAQYVYTMRRVSKSVPPKRTILKNISLNFFPGAKIGVLGLNGSGKSSLLKIMAGADDNYEGEVIRMPGIRVGYLEQEPKLGAGRSVRETVEEALADTAAAKKRLDEIYAAYSEPDADFDKLAEEQAKLEAIVNAGGADEMEVAADALRLPDWNSKIEVLSGGEKRRVALCRLLLSKPDLLLLDEPTNHLDAESVEWLEQFLQRFPGTVVAVTHDRYFLDNAAGWILELDRGYGIPWEGNYSSWLDQKEKRLAVEASQEAARIKAMQAELEWVRQNPKGRGTKSKARLARFQELSSQEYQSRNETQEIFIPVAEPRAGRDHDLERAGALLHRLVHHRLVGLQARLRLRLPGTRRHPHPLQLPLEGALAGLVATLLVGQALLLLLEPRRVVAFPRDAGAAVELEDPLRRVVEEVAIVRDGDDRAGIVLQVPLEPGDALGVEVVGRLIQKQQIRLRKQ